MVSVPRSPWLGTNAKPPEEHGVPTGKPQILGLMEPPLPSTRQDRTDTALATTRIYRIQIKVKGQLDSLEGLHV